MPALLTRIYRRLVRSRDPWRHLLASVSSRALEYDPSLDDEAKRALFKKNVTLVELEPHAYCNRTCSFCPNSTLDRLTVKSHLDVSVYERILHDLRSIDYRHVLRFARYSEPMAHDHIYEGGDGTEVPARVGDRHRDERRLPESPSARAAP